MKKVNRVLTRFISFLIIFMVFSSFVAFATSKTVKVETSFNKSIVATNGNMKETIFLTNFAGVVAGIRAYKLVVAYDSTKFDYISVNPMQGALSELTIVSTANKLVIIYTDTASGSSPVVIGAILEVNFRAKKIVGSNNFNINSGTTLNFIDCSTLSSTPTPAQATARNVLPAFSSGQAITTVLRGDVSGNGSIEINDLTAIKTYLLKIRSLSVAQREAGDIYNRGNISLVDLLAIKKDILGIQLIN